MFKSGKENIIKRKNTAYHLHTVKNKLICVVGPTAIGKTKMAIRLANAFDTEILSADSRQFYREMHIGTAKPSAEELSAAPHHFIDSLSITDEYSAGDYEKDALTLLNDLFSKHQTVILVGGSGLFVDAVCQGLDNLPKPLPGVRDKLNADFREQGIESLQRRLKEVDPAYYAAVDIHNSQRVIRALEVYESTGKPFSSFRVKNPELRNFDVIRVGLNMDRASLYARINARVDAMVAAGLEQEARALFPFRANPPLLTVGYAEFFAYFEGTSTREDAIENIKQNTRRFAKRQLTWFKRYPDTEWFGPDDFQGIRNWLWDKIGKKQ